MHIIDFIVFLLFTIGIVVFGCTFFRRGSSADEFTSAGKSLPGWVVGMSIFATYVSSISYIGYPGKAYASNWNAFVFSLSIPIASWIAARYFVPFYRKSGSVSAYSFLEEKFGPWARLYASACYLFTQIARMGSILYLLAVPMYILMGWNLHVVIIATTVAIVTYSMLGGLRAVIWADAIQGFILIGGALLCLLILIFSLPDGPMQIIDIATHSPEGNKLSLGSFGASLTESTFWVCLIYGIFTNLQNYGIDQNYVQRYHAAKSDSDARFSALFGGYLFIPVSALFFMIGTSLYAFYESGIGYLPDDIAAKPDYVFPYFIVDSLPLGLRGLLIASIFAAGMSTVSTSVTSAATIILTDYFRPLLPHWRRRMGNTSTASGPELVVLRTASVVVGIMGALVALAMLQVESIIDAWWTLSSIFSGGMLGLFFLACTRHIGRRAAFIGCLSGILVIGWISLAGPLNLPGPHLHPYLSIVLGTCVIFIVGFVITLLFNKS